MTWEAAKKDGRLGYVGICNEVEAWERRGYYKLGRRMSGRRVEGR